jgi:phage-related tail fiber protein
MAQQFFGILTQAGENKDANAKALGLPLVLTELAIGDGNGNVPVPDRLRTSLVNQVRRQPINQISKDPNNANQIVIEQVIPENEGGWWIREMGLYDKDGDLIAICNCPPSYKPQLAEGSGRTQVVRMVLIFSSAATVQLKIDPSVVMATRKYADDAMLAMMTAHESAADPHSQYATQPGEVQFFAMSTAPTGYLKANGVAVSRATYAALFAAIGTTFGAGDGSTTFTLPDLRGEFLRAFDDGRGVDSGRTFGSSQTDLFKEHNHRFINEYNTPNMRIVAYSDDNSEGVDSVNTTGLRCWTYISMENTGGSETRPRNIALLACIKF